MKKPLFHCVAGLVLGAASVAAGCATVENAGQTALQYMQGCPHYEEEVAFPSVCTQCEPQKTEELATLSQTANNPPKPEEQKPITDEQSEYLEKTLEETRDSLEDAGVDMHRIPTGYRGEGVTIERGGQPPRELILSIDGDVSFAHGSSALTPHARLVIAKMAEALANFPNSKLRFGGHTDSTGGRPLNFRLSQQRAQAVRDEMVREHGISASRILEVRGYADTQRIVQTNRAEPRNRRVEIRVVME